MLQYRYSIVVLSIVLLTNSYGDGTRKATQDDIGPAQDSSSRQAIQVTPGGSPNELWKAFCLSTPTGVTNLSVSTTTSWSQTTGQWGIYKNIPPINNVQMKDGIVLTSGKAADCAGPNNSGSKTTEFGYPGDADLVAVVGENVFDAATLIIDFTADATVKGISFDFCFGTEEYPEYVGQFNDAFICLLDGRNICFDGSGKIISVNNAFFGVVNTPNPTINLQWDGFTFVLKTSKPIAAGRHTLKFAIGDTRDAKLDAGVFLSNFKFSLDDTGTIPIVDLIKDQTFSVLEKSPAQTYVGKVINLIKKKEVSLEVMTPAKEFDIATGAWIDTNSWPITVANGAVLNVAIQKQYTIPVRASFKVTNGYKYDTATMTINILPNTAWPAIKNATIYDKNGDGKGDSISVEFVNEVPTSGFGYKTADFTWPQNQNSYSIAVSTSNINNARHLAFSYAPGANAPVWTMGKSTILIRFDSSGTEIARTSDLNDGIGPVLSEARVVKRYVPMNDTFRVLISEPVNVSAISQNSFTLIKNGHVKEIDIAPIAGTVINLGGESSIQFLISDLGADAPALGDSLKILSTGPVIDKVSVKAHKDNPPVPIKFIDNKPDPWPDISSAVIYDRNGDGKGDSIRVSFKSGFVKPMFLKRADFTWPANQLSYSVKVDSANATGNTVIAFAFAPQNNAPVWTMGKSALTIAVDSVGTEITRTADLTDGIGPLLTDAVVAKGYPARNDTFFVKITEPVTVSLISGNSFILIKKDHMKESTLAPVGSVKDLGGESYVQFAIADQGTDAPAPGDSLKILSTGPVADKLNNKAHRDNTPVPIRFTWPQINNAVIYDKNGDGKGDSIRVAFKADILTYMTLKQADFTWPQNQVSYSVQINNGNVINATTAAFAFAPQNNAPVWTSGNSAISIRLDSLQTELVRTSELLDGIGPLLTEACVVKRYKPMDDTFRVKITEPVAVAEIIGYSFILIKKEPAKEIEIAPIDRTVLDLGGEAYIQFLIKDLVKDAPAPGDSLKILSTGTVIDKRGNKAHKDNTPVPIKFVDGNPDPWPQISSAVIYDRNGDGRGDSVRIDFSANFYPPLFAQQVSFTWPENTSFGYTVTVTPGMLIGTKAIAFPFTPGNGSPVWTKGKSTLRLTVDSLQTQILRTADLLDGIGPLLTEAAVMKRYVPQNDTFRVRITEPVTAALISGKSFILIKTGHIKEIMIEPVGPVKDLGGESYIQFAVMDLGTDAPAVGDSLKILYTGPVADKPNNKAHRDNTPVPITFFDGIVPPRNAYYYDRNGDGIVDRVSIKFYDTLKTLDSVSFKITWFDIGESATVAAAAFAPGTKDSVLLDLTFTNVVKVRDKTSGEMNCTITDDKTQSNASCSVADKAAPVITVAIYYPTSFASKRYAPKNTLSITFSEAISALSSSKPFLLHDSTSGNEYHFVFEPNPTYMDKNKVLFSVQSIEGVKFPEEGDSIWINAVENVMDASSNAQLVVNNKRVRLIIVLPPFVLEPYVIGPRDPQDKVIPAELKKSNGSITNGTIILLKPNIFVPVRELLKVRVTIEIYDPLGNSIANGQGYAVNNGLVEMHARQIGQECYIIILWADGNTRNRLVGSGSYLGMLSIVYPDGSSESKKVMIPMKQ